MFVISGCGGGNTQASPTPVPPGSSSDSLQAAGRAAGKLIGAATQSGFLGDARYSPVLGREFDYLTAEYEMKWNAIEGSPGNDNFSGGDAILGYAQGRGMQVKGHALIWHGSVPGWVNSLSASDLRLAFERHIRAVGEHYRGRVLAWDVVNEAVADNGSGLRDTVFRQKLGDEYIADAFRLAREADPGALLFYNDYGGEGMGAKSDQIYDLVRGLQGQGVPIDGVGLQMHISASSRASDASIAANMRRLASLGLLVNISEMDVRVNGVAGSLASRLDAQRSAYHAVVGLCVAEPRCHAITFWGFTDAHTWISGDSPLLYDEQYAPKPAYYGVLDALRGR
jgi:endo-1,4-beta-xylanase